MFFIYANAAGIGSQDERHKNIVVDRVLLDGSPVRFMITGPVLEVPLAQSRKPPFEITIDAHGVVPRLPSSAGELGNTMAGLGLNGVLGKALGLSTTEREKPTNMDFGIFAYGNGILSLGSFWYPQLAVRENGRWLKDQPAGLGDLTYSEMSDFDVAFSIPQGVQIVATGESRPPKPLPGSMQVRRFAAQSVRDFAVMMSEDYLSKRKEIEIGGRAVAAECYVAKKNDPRSTVALDAAIGALQFFSRRFGPYTYDSFKLGEGPVGGGAGGMEFSGMASVSSMVLQDWDKQIEGALNLAGVDKLVATLNGVFPGPAGQDTAPPASLDSLFQGLLKGILAPQMELLRSLLEMTVAHEVAHQWWAIGVGSDSVRAPFVDESLANYSAILYFEDRYGRAQAERMIELHLKLPFSMYRMLGGSDAPANLPTARYENSLQYGAVVYGKGALYYDAVRRAMGDEAFFNALRRYYREYRGRIASQKDLLRIFISESHGVPVEAIYRRWIEETHGDEDISAGTVPEFQNLPDALMRMLGGR